MFGRKSTKAKSKTKKQNKIFGFIKKHKKLVIVAIVLVLAVGGYFGYSAYQDMSAKAASISDCKGSILRSGSKGECVRALQKAINDLFIAKGGTGLVYLKVDGDYGPKTIAAVYTYQRTKGFTQDGITGQQTWGGLTGDSEAASNKGSSTTEGQAKTNTTASSTPVAGAEESAKTNTTASSTATSTSTASSTTTIASTPGWTTLASSKSFSLKRANSTTKDVWFVNLFACQSGSTKVAAGMQVTIGLVPANVNLRIRMYGNGASYRDAYIKIDGKRMTQAAQTTFTASLTNVKKIRVGLTTNNSSAAPTWIDYIDKGISVIKSCG